MFVRRYLVLISDEDKYPSVLELPHETLESAWEALKAQFEKTVHTCFGETHNIKYVNDEAEMVDDDGEYELHKEGDDGPAFWVWDGDEMTYKGVIREISVPCTQQELERAYRERERSYLIEDAEHHLLSFLGYDMDAEEDSQEAAENETINQQFSDRYGYSISEAICEGSEYYCLDYLAYRFQDKMDCNLDDNSVWDNVVREFLRSEEEE